MDNRNIAITLVTGLLAGSIATYAIALPGLSNTSIGITTTTQTTTTTIESNTTITVVHTSSKNTTVAYGGFIIPANVTLPSSSAGGFNASANHTGVIIGTFAVTNETHLSVIVNGATNGLGGGQYPPPFQVEVLGSSGQVLYESSVEYGIAALSITLPLSPPTEQGLGLYYLNIISHASYTLVISLNAYLY